MSESPEEKVARLDQQTKDMAADIDEIKTDVKELRSDLNDFKTEVKSQLAKYGVYVVIGIAVVQFLISHFARN